MSQQYFYENKTGDSWLRPKAHRVELTKDDLLPAYLIQSTGYVDEGSERWSFVHKPFALNVEHAPASKDATVLHRTNSSSRAPLNSYLFNLLDSFSTQLSLPSEIKDKAVRAKELLEQFDPYYLSGQINELHILGPVSPTLNFQGFTRSLDPYYFERKDKSYHVNGEQIEKNLKILKNFLALNEEIIEYAQENIDKIEKVMGRMVVHSYIAMEYRNSDYHSHVWMKKSREEKILPTTFVDNLVLEPEISSNYYMQDRIANTHLFKTEKDFKLFSKNREQIEKDLTALIDATYDRSNKKRATTDYIIRTEEEVRDYAAKEGIKNTDTIKGYFNQRNAQSKHEIRVFAKTYLPLKKLLPHIPRLSKGLQEALNYENEYSLKNREHKDKYGEKNLYFVFASPKPEHKNSPSGFLVNKRGTRLTLDIEIAQSFASEDIARNFFLKSDKANTHDASFIKTQLRIQSFTGAQPTENKEFVNFLSQWETEEIKKMFDSPKIVEPIAPTSVAPKKISKI